MKVLTLHQPWASLVALGVKTIETRSWSTAYRGPLAIHAGVKPPCGYRDDLWLAAALWRVHRRSGDGQFDLSRFRAPDGIGGVESMWDLPLGAIVATCTLVDVAPIGRWDSFRTGVVEGDEGDLPGKPVVVNHGPQAGGRPWSLVLDQDGRVSDLTDQLPYGEYDPVAGRFAWLLADVVPMDPPAPFKGGQGLTKTWEPAEVPA